MKRLSIKRVGENAERAIIGLKTKKFKFHDYEKKYKNSKFFHVYEKT